MGSSFVLFACRVTHAGACLGVPRCPTLLCCAGSPSAAPKTMKKRKVDTGRAEVRSLQCGAPQVLSSQRHMTLFWTGTR